MATERSPPPPRSSTRTASASGAPGSPMTRAQRARCWRAYASDSSSGRLMITAPRRGSHYKVRDPKSDATLTIPARRPVRQNIEDFQPRQRNFQACIAQVITFAALGRFQALRHAVPSGMIQVRLSII